MPRSLYPVVYLSLYWLAQMIGIDDWHRNNRVFSEFRALVTNGDAATCNASRLRVETWPQPLIATYCNVLLLHRQHASQTSKRFGNSVGRFMKITEIQTQILTENNHLKDPDCDLRIRILTAVTNSWLLAVGCLCRTLCTSEEEDQRAGTRSEAISLCSSVCNSEF